MGFILLFPFTRHLAQLHHPHAGVQVIFVAVQFFIILRIYADPCCIVHILSG